MSIVTSALSQYVENNSTSLLHKGLLASRTIQLVDVVGGIKSKQHTFSIESGGLVIQAANCGIIPSGTTTISPVTIDIDRLAVKELVCQDTLEDFFASQAFKAGQTRDAGSLGVIGAGFIAEKIAAIGHEIDRLLWQGRKIGGSDQNLRQTDGFLTKLRLELSASTVNIAATALTESNAIAICKAYFDKLPAAAKTRKDITMFIGHDEFIMLQSALVPSYYPASPSEAPDVVTLDFKYRPMKIEAVTGLNDTGRKVVGPRSFFKIGTDLQADMPIAKGGSGMGFYYSDDDEVHYFRSKWAQGVGVAIPSFIVNDQS